LAAVATCTRVQWDRPERWLLRLPPLAPTHPQGCPDEARHNVCPRPDWGGWLMRTPKPILRLDLANLTARRQLLLYVALPLAYIVTGRLGLLLAADPGYATVVFLPAGIAITATFFAGATS